MIDLDADEFVVYKKKGRTTHVGIPTFYPMYLKYDIFLKEITKIYDFEYRGKSKIKKWKQYRKKFKRVRI